MRLHLHARGAITNLAVEPLPVSIESGDLNAGEVRLRVHAVSLNFRDVLNVLGEYPGDPGPPGGDSAGSVAATSERCDPPLCWRPRVWLLARAALICGPVARSFTEPHGEVAVL